MGILHDPDQLDFNQEEVEEQESLEQAINCTIMSYLFWLAETGSKRTNKWNVKVINQSFFRICNKSEEARIFSFHGLCTFSEGEKNAQPRPHFGPTPNIHSVTFLVFQTSILLPLNRSAKSEKALRNSLLSLFLKKMMTRNLPLKSATAIFFSPSPLALTLSRGEDFEGPEPELIRHVKDQVTYCGIV